MESPISGISHYTADFLLILIFNLKFENLRSTNYFSFFFLFSRYRLLVCVFCLVNKNGDLLSEQRLRLSLSSESTFSLQKQFLNKREKERYIKSTQKQLKNKKVVQTVTPPFVKRVWRGEKSEEEQIKQSNRRHCQGFF